VTFFVIVDFGGYVANSAFAAAGWSATTEATTGTVNGTSTSASAAVDSVSISNLRFTYNGTADLGPGIDLGTFGAVTTLTGQSDGVVLAIDHSFSSPSNTVANTDVAPVPVPLPATANMGIALAASVVSAGIWRRRKSSRQPALG